MTPSHLSALALIGSVLLLPGVVSAQALTSAGGPRPWGRVSFFSNAVKQSSEGGLASASGELTTAFSYQLPEHEASSFEYAFDVRHANYPGTLRTGRLTLYEAFVGGRVADGRVRLRAGQLWLRDLGGLGAVGGGAVEWVQPRSDAGTRFRVGAFGGLEPKVLQAGFVSGIRKAGAYLTYEVGAARRHTLGYVRVSNESLTERSVLATTNFWPLAGRLFIYQAMEYDLQAPAGEARPGLAYLFATTRFLVNERVELQGTYSRGHSVDIRGLSENVLAGRPVTQASVEGLLYESIGGRATVEVLPRTRIYGGYASDRNSRDASRGGRLLIGGHAADVAGSGLDISASDTLTTRTTGRHHSRFVSIGRQLGRVVYASVDFNDSLAVVRFSRVDGVIVESRPRTHRWSGTASVMLVDGLSLLLTGERTRDDDYAETRFLAGLTYRLR